MRSIIEARRADERPSEVAGLRGVFRPEIEGLRAIAILLILAFHTGVGGFSGGYVGVDVFFVLSGYLITGLLIREIERTGTINIPAFYARRARRLLPALSLTVAATILACALVYAPVEVNRADFADTAVSTAVYVSNLYFARSGTDYFAADRGHNPLLHTWSLSVEEQFYLVWPLFVMFGLGVLSWQKRDSLTRRRLLWWMVSAIGLSFVFSAYLTHVRQPWAYFTSLTRAWQFAIGATVVLLPQKHPFLWLFNMEPHTGIRGPRVYPFNPLPLHYLRRLAGKASGLSGWAGLAGIVVAAVAFGRTTLFPGIAALLPTLSTALVLRASTNPAGGPMVRMLSIKPLQEIGRLSYSWYLWHWPVIVIGSAIITAPSLRARAGMAALSFLISLASFRLVEDPIRHSAALGKRPLYSLTLAVFLAIFGISLSLAWKQFSFRAAGEPAQARFIRASKDLPKLRRGCSANFSDVNLKACAFGVESSSTAVALFGDSKAAHWFPALEPIAAKRNWRLEVMVKGGCPPVDAPLFIPSMGRYYTECAQWRKQALQRIHQIRPFLSVVTFSEKYLFQDEEWRDGFARIADELAESSENVLILRDTPSADFDILACLARREWRPAFIPASSCQFAHPATSRLYEIQNLVARRHRNVLVADLSSSICPGGLCTGERGDEIIYRDEAHLTASFISRLQGVLNQEIDRATERGAGNYVQ